MECDFVSACLEEVALEGLDGITTSALWTRLGHRPSFPIALDDKSKAYLWRVTVLREEVEVYEMPEPRSHLVVNTWDSLADPETGICMDLEVPPENIYPFCVVDKQGVRGSCSTFDTRKSVTTEVKGEDGTLLYTLDEAIERWGERLVLVASQQVRNTALYGETADPKIESTDVAYCVLERIGRSRYEGELMGGKNAQSVFKASSKDMFYHRKHLIRHGFIKKQSLVMRNVQNRQTHMILVHLPRFYRVRRPRYSILLEKMCQKLAQSPHQRSGLRVCREAVGIDANQFKKLFPIASPYIQRMELKYGDVYPDSSAEEKILATGEERVVAGLRLVKMYPSPDNSEDEEEEEEEKSLNTNTQPKLETLYHERPLLDQIYDVIDAAGPEGMTQIECQNLFGMNKLEGRAALRGLQKIGLVADSVMKSFGRQRTGVFVSMRHEKCSSLHQEYKEQHSKLKELYESPSLLATPDTDGKRSVGDKLVNSAEEGIAEADTEDEPVTDWDQSLIVNNLIKPSVSLTSRTLRRANMILSAVQEAKIIENPILLQRMIVHAEAKEEDSPGRLDKKSLLRILSWLARAGQINSIKTVIKAGNREKSIHLICDKSIGPGHSLVASTIEQARLKQFAIPRDGILKTKGKVANKRQQQEATMENTPPVDKSFAVKVSDTVRESIQKLHSYRLQGKQEDMVYDAQAGRRYGIVPKFKRQKIVHQLVWYLVNDYRGNQSGTAHAETPEPLAGMSTDVLSASFQNLYMLKEPLVYLDELSWKRFLPPVRQHVGYPPGWFLISDVLIMLPVKVFCQIINVTYHISGLQDLLNDPVKQFYPVSSLPFKMTQQLLFQRKYLYCFHDILVQLCHLGLLSFGQTQHREKDQIFIYLHHNASIVDTSTSLPGYMICRPTPDFPFVTKHYHFSNSSDVEKYWCDLMYIALNTHLGMKVDFETTHLEKAIPVPEGRKSLQKAVAPVTVETVRDDGIIPGDGRGAGGLDTSKFSHLHRNWDPNKVRNEEWKKNLYKPPKPVRMLKKKEVEKENVTSPEVTCSPSIAFDQSSPHQRLSRLMPHQKLTLMETTKDKEPEVVKSTLVAGAKGNKGGKGIKRKRQEPIIMERRPKKIKKLSYAKGGPHRNPPKRRRNRILSDQKDRDALKLMKKHRVVWTAAEDSLLLLAKVASLFLCCKRKGILVCWSLIRDILHDAFTVSKDKTSKACQRRVAFAMKNPQTVLNVQTFLAEARHDKSLVKDFRSKMYKCTDEDLVPAFTALLQRLKEKFISGQYSKRTILPASLAELNARYIVTEVGCWKDKTVFSDVQNNVDIQIAVLRDIIHSYMSLDDKKGRGYEMYHLFNQYGDNLLSDVYSTMTSDGIITRLKKGKKFLLSKLNRVSSIHAHHLSQTYFNRLITRLPRSVFGECVDQVTRLWQLHCDSQAEGQVELHAETGGDAAAVISLSAMGMLKFESELPEQILVLDTVAMQMYPVGRGRPLWQASIIGTQHTPETSEQFEDDVTAIATVTESVLTKSNDLAKSATSVSQIETASVSTNTAATDFQGVTIDSSKTAGTGTKTDILPHPSNTATADSQMETVAVPYDSHTEASTDPPKTETSESKTDTSTEPPKTGTTESQTDTLAEPPKTGTSESQTDTSAEPPKTGTTESQTDTSAEPPKTGTTESQTDTSAEPPKTGTTESQTDTSAEPSKTGTSESQTDTSTEPPKTTTTDSQADTVAETPKTITDTNRPLSTASRSMLSVLRNQCMEGFDPKNINPQDYFLINSCSIKAALRNTCLSSRSDSTMDAKHTETFDQSQTVIFLGRAKVKEIVKSQMISQPQILASAAIWGKLGTHLSPEKFDDAEAIYSAVDKAKELGVREVELRDHFQGMIYSDFRRCIQTLRDEQLIRKTSKPQGKLSDTDEDQRNFLHQLPGVHWKIKPVDLTYTKFYTAASKMTIHSGIQA